MARNSIHEMEKLRAQMQEMVESRPEDEGNIQTSSRSNIFNSKL